MKFFENFYFLKILYLLKMCPIFVNSVHNFGKSIWDIQKKTLIGCPLSEKRDQMYQN